LLVPQGQFGTRLTGGKDAASPRYIFTYLSSIARYLFPEEDDALLRYLEDDGQIIEPEYYCPILPMLLINGSQGIGTGWSTQIPSYDPEDVLLYIIAKLDGLEDLPPIRPYARGYTGTIEPSNDGTGFVTCGRAKQTGSSSLEIDELPLNCWTDQYKQRLLKMRNRGEIVSFVENHTTTKVSFKVYMKAVKLKRLLNGRGGLVTAFKLRSNLSTSNMNAFDANGCIKKFDSAEELADLYFPVRLAMYHDRKSLLQSDLKHASVLMRNKADFVQAVLNGSIDLVSGKHSKAEIIEQLKGLGLASASDLTEIKNNNTVFKRNQCRLNDLAAEEQQDGETSSVSGDYDYLLNMPLSSLTTERIAQLNQDALNKERALEEMERKSPEDLWRADLEKLAPLIRKLKASSA
jgi:DNA topoisomerase II